MILAWVTNLYQKLLVGMCSLAHFQKLWLYAISSLLDRSSNENTSVFQVSFHLNGDWLRILGGALSSESKSFTSRVSFWYSRFSKSFFFRKVASLSQVPFFSSRIPFSSIEACTKNSWPKQPVSQLGLISGSRFLIRCLHFHCHLPLRDKNFVLLAMNYLQVVLLHCSVEPYYFADFTHFSVREYMVTNRYFSVWRNSVVLCIANSNQSLCRIVAGIGC